MYDLVSGSVTGDTQPFCLLKAMQISIPYVSVVIYVLISSNTCDKTPTEHKGKE